MANTFNTSLPKNVWTDISTSDLTVGVDYTLQNRGSTDIQIIERDAPPAASDIGFLLHPKKFTAIKRSTGFELYCKPIQGAGNVSISEAV